jgi:hypothetical protein
LREKLKRDRKSQARKNGTVGPLTIRGGETIKSDPSVIIVEINIDGFRRAYSPPRSFRRWIVGRRGAGGGMQRWYREGARVKADSK